MISIAIGLVRRADSVLTSVRRPEVHQGGLREFPGGKIEPGESPERALARELKEETGVVARNSEPLIQFPWRYRERRLRFHVFTVRDFDGAPRLAGDNDLRWTKIEALRAPDFPPASRAMINALRLPDRYLITPNVEHPARFLQCFRRALERGVRLAVFRDNRLDDDDYEELARRMATDAAAFHARVLLHDRDPALLAHPGAGAAGVHLSAAALRRCRRRPVAAGRWFGASCHNADELKTAASLDADFAVLGPVRETPGHPGARGLGWDAFATLVQDAPMPVYGLGGLGPEDLAQCRHHGGHGIAAIRSLWGSGRRNTIGGVDDDVQS